MENSPAPNGYRENAALEVYTVLCGSDYSLAVAQECMQTMAHITACVQLCESTCKQALASVCPEAVTVWSAEIPPEICVGRHSPVSLGGMLL